jgi:hypothetical protein
MFLNFLSNQASPVTMLGSTILRFLGTSSLRTRNVIGTVASRKVDSSQRVQPSNCEEGFAVALCHYSGSQEYDHAPRSANSRALIHWRPLGDQLSFDGLEHWVSLPSPKMRTPDKVGVYSWTPFYAAFSERFASAAIELLRPGKRSPTILDPFVGGGTTMVAAAKLGLPAIGVDLDPFAALLSRARIATKANTRRVLALLANCEKSRPSPFSDEARDLFRDSDLCFASSVIDRLRTTLPESSAESAFKSLLDDPRGKYDSEVVALAALCLAAGTTAKVVRGSNPVWFRKALSGEIGRMPSLATTARSACRMMLDTLVVLAPSVSRRRVRVYSEDIRHTSLASACADIVITSPPYLNRLDYVVSHLAPLTMLAGLLPISLETLRRNMIGTTKIVERGRVSKAWGKSCLAFLETVAEHPSKASATYYYWNYYKYFKDLYMTFSELKRLVRRGGRGAYVIQNSFYKDIAVPTPNVIVEIARNHGIDATLVKTEVVRGHMGNMSPRQNKYTGQKVLQECIVTLEF